MKVHKLWLHYCVVYKHSIWIFYVITIALFIFGGPRNGYAVTPNVASGVQIRSLNLHLFYRNWYSKHTLREDLFFFNSFVNLWIMMMKFMIILLVFTLLSVYRENIQDVFIGFHNDEETPNGLAISKPNWKIFSVGKWWIYLISFDTIWISPERSVRGKLPNFNYILEICRFWNLQVVQI